MMHLTDYTSNQNRLLKIYRINPIYVFASGLIYFVSGVYFASLLISLNYVVAFVLLVVVSLISVCTIVKLLKIKFVFHEFFFFIEKGVFNRSKDVVEYFRIVDIQKKQPFYLRPLKLAIYHLYTSDINQQIVTLKAIQSDDDFFFMTLRILINEARKRYRLLETI